MKVQFNLVGHDTGKDSGIVPEIVVDLSAIPQIGDIIQWPGVSQVDTYVRTIVWYISHDEDGAVLKEPFVYVVVGPSREASVASRFERYLQGSTLMATEIREIRE